MSAGEMGVCERVAKYAVLSTGETSSPGERIDPQAIRELPQRSPIYFTQTDQPKASWLLYKGAPPRAYPRPSSVG